MCPAAFVASGVAALRKRSVRKVVKSELVSNIRHLRRPCSPVLLGRLLLMVGSDVPTMMWG